MVSPRNSSVNTGFAAFFTKTLVRSWSIFNDIQWKREQTLQTILSQEEPRINTEPRTSARLLILHLLGNFIVFVQKNK